jgi:succinyl-CoA synthetase beta subunit
MKLHEYQSKSLFAKYDIPVPRGRVVSTSHEAKQITEDLGGRSVIKAQVLAGGRGKVGGIRLAKTPKEAEELAAIVLGMEIKGLPVRRVLVDEMVSFTQEIYLAITNDRSARRPVLVASSAGGVDIEITAIEHPEKIIKILINPLLGLRDYQVRDIAVGMELKRSLWRAFNEISANLWKVYCASDATLAEINPLVVTTDGKLIALDGKMVLDDNALYRHPDLAEQKLKLENTA